MWVIGNDLDGLWAMGAEISPARRISRGGGGKKMGGVRERKKERKKDRKTERQKREGT